MPVHYQVIPDTESQKLQYLAGCKMLRKSNLKLDHRSSQGAPNNIA